MIHADSTLTVPKDFRLREVQGEAVVLSVGTGIYFGLDEVGTQMWRSLTTHGSVSEAELELAEVHAVGPERLHAGLKQFVEELVARKLFIPETQ